MSGVKDSAANKRLGVRLTPEELRGLIRERGRKGRAGVRDIEQGGMKR